MEKKIPHCRNKFKINIKILKRGKFDMHDRSLSWLGTGTWQDKASFMGQSLPC
jgi:hypothetical protein